MIRRSPAVLVFAVCVSVLVLATAAADGAVTYTARGLIEVAPFWQAPTADLQGVAPATIPPAYFTLYMNSTVSSVKRTRVLQVALDALRGDQNLYVGVGAAERLAKDLRVEYVPGTQDIAVSLTGPNREVVHALVREVLIQFTSQLRNDRDQENMDRQKGLHDEQRDLRKQVDRLAQDLAHFRDGANLVITDDKPSETLARLTALARQLAETQAALAEAGAEHDAFRNLQRETEKKSTAEILMALPDLGETLRNDPRIAAAQQELDRREMDAAIAKAAGKDADAATAEKVAKAVREVLEKRRSEVLDHLIQEKAAKLKTRFDRLRGTEADLLRRVDEARKAAADTSRRIDEFQMRQDEFRRVLATLNAVTNALEHMRIEAAIARPNVRVKSYPDIPTEPDPPAAAPAAGNASPK